MGPSTRRAFRALIAALIPPEPVLPGVIDEIDDSTRRLLRYMHPLMALGFVVMLHLLDCAPIWTFRSWRRIRSLPAAQGSAILAHLAESRLALIRTMLMGAKGAILSTYFDLPAVHTALGHDPRPFMRSRIALRQRLKAGEPATAADLIGPGPGGLP